MSITQRIDNITHIPDNYLKRILPAPKSVKIELTGRCNFACAFCARSMKLRSQQDMSKKEFIRLARDMYNSGVEELGLFYLGESFLVSWLDDAVRIAKDIGFSYVFLTTNGSLAKPDKVRSLMESGLDSLKFSLNYSDEIQLHNIAGVKKSIFRKIIDNIKQSYEIRKENNYDCGLYASYIRYDDDQDNRMKSIINELEPFLDEIYALPLYNQANLVTHKLKDSDNFDTPTAGNMGRAAAMVPPLPCWAVFTEGHITWDGKLSACCFDHNEELIMADLNELNFMDGWNSQQFQDLRLSHMNRNVRGTACEGCIAYKF